MTEHTHLITIRFDILEGDGTNYVLEPTQPNIGIEEVLRVQLVNGMWKVTGTDPKASKSWIGHRKNRNAAVLDYLAARLWTIEIKSKGEEHD